MGRPVRRLGLSAAATAALCCCLAVPSVSAGVGGGAGAPAAAAGGAEGAAVAAFAPPIRPAGASRRAAGQRSQSGSCSGRHESAVTPMPGAGRRGGVGWGWWSLGATTASRAESSSSVEAAPAAAMAAAAAAAAPAAPAPVQMDPFRPARAAVDPVVINILVKILGSGEDAERVANKAVRKRMRNPETELTVEERRLIYKRVYGVEVLRGRLSFLLEHAVKTSPLVDRRFGPTPADFGLPMNATGDPMLVVNRAECLLALYMMTEEGASVEFLDSDRLEVLGAVGEKLAKDELDALFDAGFPDDPVGKIAARHSFPEWMVRQWVTQLGADGADAMAARLNARPPTTLRVNTLKTSREAVVQELKKRNVEAAPTRYSPWGVEVAEGSDFRVFAQDVYKLGYVDLMNEASQCVVLSTGAKPYDIVLLHGARKGGKALALASMLRGNGMIYLWEPYLRQHYQLREAIRRGQAQDLTEVLPNVNAAMRIKADVVLVDALCSNTGALAHHPSLRWAKNATHVAEVLVPQQRTDLSNAARAVSPGGVLVYSTCSLLAEENQGVAEWFDETFAEEFEPLPFDKTGGPGGNRRVLLPHVHGVDGTFVARWRRKAAGGQGV